mmetsp:Transcript_404/g.574  ORF Transcript_404/g.574 Transcript_404/m.574 type:complete len:82 (+) Transcript_404:318-563(+)
MMMLESVTTRQKIHLNKSNLDIEKNVTRTSSMTTLPHDSSSNLDDTNINITMNEDEYNTNHYKNDIVISANNHNSKRKTFA